MHCVGESLRKAAIFCWRVLSALASCGLRILKWFRKDPTRLIAVVTLVLVWQSLDYMRERDKPQIDMSQTPRDIHYSLLFPTKAGPVLAHVKCHVENRRDNQVKVTDVRLAGRPRVVNSHDLAAFKDTTKEVPLTDGSYIPHRLFDALFKGSLDATCILGAYSPEQISARFDVTGLVTAGRDTIELPLTLYSYDEQLHQQKVRLRWYMPKAKPKK